MKWVNILHLYQPPTQTREVVDNVVRESYEKIISLLDEYPNLKLTINISGSLLELLEKYGHTHIISGIKKHADLGAVELLGTAMYHPILPLLNEKEILRQIKLHKQISLKCFGKAFSPRGFYLPEMAYSANVAKAIEKAGFDWVILDEIHTTETVDFTKLYTIEGSKIKAIFRNSVYSKTFPPEYIVENLKKIKLDYIVTCHDGELYGHWHKDDRGFYEKAFSHPEISTITASSYLAELLGTNVIKIRDASWESQPEELEQNITLGLWNNPRNKIHMMLESFKRDVLTLIESCQSDPEYATARYHADRGVASCAWWWASEKKIGPFSPVSWNPTEIEKGAHELHLAVISLASLSPEQIEKFNLLFKNLHIEIWKKHKDKYDPSYQIE
jgi:predicted glycosyl hydrolase (DUF1957 family)